MLTNNVRKVKNSDRLVEIDTYNGLIFKNDEGIKLTVDTNKLILNEAQKAALEKLIKTADLDQLDKNEKDAFSTIKASAGTMGGATTSGVIVNFSWHWVIIDDPKPILELTEHTESQHLHKKSPKPF